MSEDNRQNADDLAGKLLIAMPGIADPRFERAVVLVCEQSEEGTMGLIINKLAEDISLDDLADQLDLGAVDETASQVVHFGGPVEMGRGFVLHSDEYVSGVSSHEIIAGVRLSTSVDVLEDIAKGTGPRRALLALGYAGWGAGQLEAEIRQNGWLIAPAEAGFVFGGSGDGKWVAALRKIGVDPLLLSSDAGHA